MATVLHQLTSLERLCALHLCDQTREIACLAASHENSRLCWCCVARDGCNSKLSAVALCLPRLTLRRSRHQIHLASSQEPGASACLRGRPVLAKQPGALPLHSMPRNLFPGCEAPLMSLMGMRLESLSRCFSIVISCCSIFCAQPTGRISRGSEF